MGSGLGFRDRRYVLVTRNSMGFDMGEGHC